MASYNRVTLLGNLTRDPELKYTQSGTPIVNITLALNRKWKDQSGEPKEEVSFIDCTAWSRTAEVIGQYTKKGHPLLVEGRLKQDVWEDKQTGQKRSKVGVVIETMTLLGGGRRGDNGEATAKPAATTTQPATRTADPAYVPPAEDDVPF
jgi:single-strand DNA-binding protein